MRTVSGWVVGRSPVLVVFFGVILGLLLPAPLLAFVLPAPVPLILGPCLGVAGLAWLVSWMYPTVRFDETDLYLGRRTVPLTSLTRVERTFTGGHGPTYLIYRLVSSAGPRARVLLGGGPLKPIGPDGLAALRDLIATAPVVAPADGLSEDQRTLLARLKVGAAVAVSAAQALREIDEARGVQPPQVIEPPWHSEEEIRLFLEEHDAAERAIAARPQGAARMRRAAVGGLVVAGLAVLGGAIVGVVLEQSDALTDEANMLVALAVVGGIVLGLLAGLVLCLAHDLDVRRGHQIARRAARDRQGGGQGLPVRYLDALALHGDWTARVLLATLGSLGLVGVIVGIVIHIELGGTAGAVTAIVSGVLGAAAIPGWRQLTRRRNERLLEVVVLAGPQASLLVHGSPVDLAVGGAP
ncbi:hypothetical protein [Georgenia alba]|uniref:PH domain-containing protein n=1 Tax=Georgenia alba TaxID=2233858 RepID=A0ABW2Q583_9MICO